MKQIPFKRSAGLFLSALLIVGLAGVYGQKSEAADGKKVYELKTWSRTDCTSTPYVVAEKKGYFDEVGIKMVYTGETQGAAKLPSILTGDNNIGTIHPNGLAIARANGAKVRAIARSIVEPPDNITDPHLQHMWWISHKDSNIKTFDDIKNAPGKVKVQVVSASSCTNFLTDLALQQRGIPLDKVEYVVMPDIEGVVALKNKHIDLIVPHPPFYKAAEDTGVANILLTSRSIAGENSGTYLYYVSDDFLAKNPEVLQRFVTAIKKAERWANENPDQAAKWTSEAIGVPVLATHYYSLDAKIIEPHIQQWIDGAVSSGALKAGQIKPADFITHDFEKYGEADKKVASVE
ncbi:MAG: ABC transporter substrate-binding protein [Deltaproteobacteria bacterium]|jgi:ABC-type nitrate/sulfonate/bicarbonate transport system substrate-binding protein|nr:ABC transporter substrate-binding protein [Deltaproteobacteria bacterium]